MLAAREAASRPDRRFALRATPAVLAALQDLPGALDEAAESCGVPLRLLPDPAASLPQIEEDHDGR